MAFSTFSELPIMGYSFLQLSIYGAVAALCFAMLHYVVAVVSFSLAARRRGTGKSPPLVPHIIPFFGSLPVGYFWNARSFVSTSKYAFHSPHPVRVKFMFQDFYIIQGARNIVALFKQHSLSAFAVHGSLLRYVFSLPVSAANTYYKDDSGEHEKPHEDSFIEPRNRVDFLTRSSFHKFLTGPGLAPLSVAFEQNITQRLQSLDVGRDWTRFSDLMDIFHHDVTSAVIDAMCGGYLLNKHPGFTRDFWTCDHNIMTLFARTPRILAPNAHKARDRALAAVKEWQSWARSNFTPELVGADGNDPFWGTKFFRDRHDMFLNMDGFNTEAVASQELAFLWGANTNAIVSAFWVTLEVLRDDQLLHEVRKEVESCMKPDSTPKNLRFDIPKLLSQPLLQAIFAETLRLRVNGFLVRRPMKGDLHINEWTLSKDRFCLTSSTPGHMDPVFWCKGPNAQHPVNEFWPARFLKKDPSTGALQFSLRGTEGSWMPFGGGTHICPGKNFAKLVNFLTVALLITKYDFQNLANRASMEMSMRNFGFGTLSPAEKVPVMIRQRAGM